MTPRPSVSRMRRFTPSPSSSVRSSIDQRSPSHSARSPTVPRSNGTLTRSSSTRSLASSEIYNLNSDDEDDDGRGKTRPTPVPYRKVLALSVSRVTEGMIWAGILPYVNAMMRDIGVAEHDVGIWSAVAESAFMVFEAIAAPFYVAPADRYGRRPIILCCIGLWGVSAVAFGSMKTVFGIIAMRSTLGMLARAGLLSRTMLGEVSDATNRVQCFAIFSPALTIGTTIGPVIGGTFANPVPRLLSPSFSLFVDYPYLLPSLISGICGFVSFGIGLAYIPETLPAELSTSARRRAQGEVIDLESADANAERQALNVGERGHRRTISLNESDEDEGDLGQSSPSSHRPTTPSFEKADSERMKCTRGTGGSKPDIMTLLRYKPYQRVLILYTLSSGLQMSLEAVFPLFAYTSPDLGGLGMPVEAIGHILAVSALLSIGMTLILYPYLHNVIPKKWYLITCLAAWPITVITFPLLWSSAQHPNAKGGISFQSLCLLAVNILSRRIGDFAVTLLDTNVVANVPSAGYNALANSAVVSIGAISRALCPLVMSYFFSLSTRFDASSIGRQTVWAVFLLANLPGLYLAWTTRSS